MLGFWKNRKPSYERAMDWCKAHTVPGQGIIVHTKQPVPYPEVTGYCIPTLYFLDAWRLKLLSEGRQVGPAPLEAARA